jgi:hypothetical protein
MRSLVPLVIAVCMVSMSDGVTELAFITWSDSYGTWWGRSGCIWCKRANGPLTINSCVPRLTPRGGVELPRGVRCRAERAKRSTAAESEHWCHAGAVVALLASDPAQMRSPDRGGN